MTGWRLRSLAREAFIQARESWPRTIVTVVSAAAICGALAFAELRTATGLLAYHDSFVAAGGTVAVVSSPTGQVSAARCAALVASPAVRAAGALTPTGTISLAASPQTLVQTATVTAGMVALLDRSAPASAATVVGDGLAAELGLRAGGSLPTNDATLTVDAVAATAQRAPQLDRTIMRVVPPVGQAAQCWVELRPADHAGGVGTLDAWFDTGAAGSDLDVSALRTTNEFSRDPAAELRDRPQRNAWVIAGIALVVTGWLATWLRRAELGLHMALGGTRASLVVLAQMEALLLLPAGAVVGGLWAAAAASVIDGLPSAAALTLSARTAGSATALAVLLLPLGVLLAARHDVAALLKDR